MGDTQIGMRQGLRTKYRGGTWTPAESHIPMPSDEVMAILRRHVKGEALESRDFPEAAAVWNEAYFKRTKDLFVIGGFYAVKGRLAEVLPHFDLGAGGLIPFTILQADLETPYEGEFFLLNFGGPKNSFIAELSDPASTQQLAIDRVTGKTVWDVNFSVKDDDVALTPAALRGADLWIEDTVYSWLFMSDGLVAAIKAAKVDLDFRLHSCRIVEPA